MGEEIEEAVVIETAEPGTDLEVADARAPATLFRTDDPAEVVARATAVADVLTDVLRKRELVKRIGNKDYVQVEGWTLCGSMLGVFGVVEWTHKIEDGWEARAVARTLSGAVVGAAEAECLRTEKEWGPNPTRGKMRDDYALKSMAQTRALSKCLRAPLGFIIQLAGFEATPAEEMPAETTVRREEGPPPVPVPQSWPDIEKTVRGCDNPEEAWALFEAFIRACSYHLFGTPDSNSLTTEEKTVMGQKAAGAAVWLVEKVPHEGAGFTFYTEDWQRRAWSAVLDGSPRLEIPDYEAPELPKASEQLDPAEEAARAAEAGDDIPADSDYSS